MRKAPATIPATGRRVPVRTMPVPHLHHARRWTSHRVSCARTQRSRMGRDWRHQRQRPGQRQSENAHLWSPLILRRNAKTTTALRRISPAHFASTFAKRPHAAGSPLLGSSAANPNRPMHFAAPTRRAVSPGAHAPTKAGPFARKPPHLMTFAQYGLVLPAPDLGVPERISWIAAWPPIVTKRVSPPTVTNVKPISIILLA
jgi:hypothetical protein